MMDLQKEMKRNENAFDQIFKEEKKTSQGSKDKDLFDVICDDD